MKWPSRKELDRVLKKLESVEGTLAPPANPTPLEKFRHDIQQKVVGYMLVKKISQRELAKILEIDEGKVSKIVHNRLEEFSTDRLINLYQKLNPNMELKVS